MCEALGGEKKENFPRQKFSYDSFQNLQEEFLNPNLQPKSHNPVGYFAFKVWVCKPLLFPTTTTNFNNYEQQTITITMTIHSTFPWKKPSQADVYTSSVKWSQTNTKYEIYAATLEDMDS